MPLLLQLEVTRWMRFFFYCYCIFYHWLKWKTQQSCQNLVRSYLLPENGKGMFNFISLGEEAGAEEEAMLKLLGGPRFNWEKRSRREFELSGLGSKWKESNKGSASSIFFFLFLHWGSPQCLLIHLFSGRKIKIKCLFVRIPFCYDFKKLSNNFSQSIVKLSFWWAQVLIDSGWVKERSFEREGIDCS